MESESKITTNTSSSFSQRIASLKSVLGNHAIRTYLRGSNAVSEVLNREDGGLNWRHGCVMFFLLGLTGACSAALESKAIQGVILSEPGIGPTPTPFGVPTATPFF